MILIPIYDKINFISAAKAAKKLGITSRRIRVLAKQGRIQHAYFDAYKGWQLPKDELTVSPGARGPEFGIKARAKKTKPYLSVP